MLLGDVMVDGNDIYCSRHMIVDSSAFVLIPIDTIYHLGATLKKKPESGTFTLKGQLPEV